MIKLGASPEIKARRARLLVALSRKPGTAVDMAKALRRIDIECTRDDLETLRKLGLVERESKPAVYRLV